MAESMTPINDGSFGFKVIATTVTASAFLITAWNFYQSGRKEVEAANQAVRARIWEQRLRLYDESCRATGQLVACYAVMVRPATEGVTSELDRIEPAAARENYVRSGSEFWRLYWGSMSLIEDTSVEQAMVLFGKGWKPLIARSEPLRSDKRLMHHSNFHQATLSTEL